jgi:AP-1 complex subunit mu
MTVSAVFIMDAKGKILISRNYRGDLPLSQADVFSKIIAMDHQEPPPPVIFDGDVSYLYVVHNGLYIMALTKSNTNPMTIFSFLYGLVDVLTSYFNVLNEQSVQENFVLLYELLDETMDYGHPQTIDASILKEFICIRDQFRFFDLEADKQPKTIPKAMTQKVARNTNVSYTKNEVYLDVIEKLSLLLNPQGQVISSEILGSLMMRTQLSGIPELKLGLNDKIMFEQRQTKTNAKNGTANNSKPGTKGVEMEDIRFHQCVELGKFDSDRSIVFVPPDGEFELMSYRLTAPVRPLIMVECHIEQHQGSRIKFLVKVRSNYKKRSCATNVKIHIPVPPDADSPLFSLSTGSAVYTPENDECVWTIKQLTGQKEVTMRCQLGLPTISSEATNHYLQTKKPIKVEFELPYFTVSGLQVRYLKISERSRYVANPWVRYITQSGDYEVRF